jgi:hypothetical protein
MQAVFIREIRKIKNVKYFFSEQDVKKSQVFSLKNTKILKCQALLFRSRRRKGAFKEGF